MKANEFVHQWLNENLSPESTATPEQQSHFESILCDVCEDYFHSHPFIKDVYEGRSIIIAKDWLEKHERNIRKEQRKEDIEKACEWLDRYMVNEVCAGNHSRQYADSFMEKFKKAMEE